MKKNTTLCFGLFSLLLLNDVMAAGFSTITDVINGQGNNYAQDLVTQMDGKAVVAGFYYDTHIKQNGSFILRYTTEGALDTTFGANGIKVLETLPGGEFSTLNKLGVLSDGKILLVGQMPQNGLQKLLLSRLNSNGSLDTTFGSNGYILTELTNIYPNVVHLISQNDDSFFVTLNNKNAVTILKFNANGSLNTSFANGGILISDISGGQGSYSSTLALQNDGKLVVAGGYIGDDFKGGFVARYDDTGVLDNSFGSNGVVTYRTSNSSTDYFTDVSIQNDGKVVLTGTSADKLNNMTTMLLVRYLSNGTLDTTFAAGGVINACPNYEQNNCSGLSVTVKANGNLLVGGQLISEDSTLPLLYQFDTTGTLLTSYGSNGSKVFENVSNHFNFSANGLDNLGNDMASGNALIDGLFKVVLMTQ